MLFQACSSAGCMPHLSVEEGRCRPINTVYLGALLSPALGCGRLAEAPVAGVAQAGHDEPVLVEHGVYGGGYYVGVFHGF